MDTPETLGTPDLRRILRCDRKTVLRWIRLGKLEATKDERGRWRVAMDAAVRLRKQHGTRRNGYGPFGPRHGGEWYTASERELLRSELSHEEVGKRIGRSTMAVEIQRIRMRQGKTRNLDIKRRAVEVQEGAVGKWFISFHAVKRYCERVAPGTAFKDALAILIAMSEEANKRARRLPSGALEYDVRGIRCVVVPSRNGRKLPVLVTVKARRPACAPSS